MVGSGTSEKKPLFPVTNPHLFDKLTFQLKWDVCHANDQQAMSGTLDAFGKAAAVIYVMI